MIDAYTVKVDRDKQLVCVDELIEQITMEELQEQLPGHQPRYIVYRYVDSSCSITQSLPKQHPSILSQLQNDSRRPTGFLSNVFHILYTQRQSNGTADDVCRYQASATKGGWFDESLWNQGTGWVDRGVAEGEFD